MRVVRIVDAVGSALILQLCFVLCAIPVVTILPSAVALQRSLDDYRTGEQTGLRPFVNHLSRAWTQYWRLSVVATPVVLAWSASLAFWASTGSSVGRVALGVMFAWSGLGAATYLALLAGSTTIPSETGVAGLRRAVSLVVSHPLRALAGLALLWSWLIVLAAIPTLALVGSGLVPALIARHALAGSEAPRQSGEPAESGPPPTGTTTSLRRRNHGVQGGSNRAKRGGPATV